MKRKAAAGFQENDFTRILMGLVGMLIFAAGINLFIVPAQLYNGGVLGISQIIRTLLVRYAHLNIHNVDLAGIINLILNIPLFFLAYHSVGRRFFWKTLICVLSQTFFLTVIPIPSVPIVEDALTASLIGGIIVGAGIGTALRSGGSSGGLDIVGMYFTKKYKDFSVGRLSLFVNILIYATCALLFDISIVVYCVIYSAVSTLIMDRTHTQNISTEVFIFTKEDPAEIMSYILKNLERGTTYWEGKGGYTDKQTNIIFAVVSKHELSELKRELHMLDPHAFLVSKEGIDIDGRFVKHL